MCVIFVADQERPTREMLELGRQHNNHATGIAWRGPSPDDEKKTVVHWKKGNDIPLDEVIHLAETLPMPYVIHFRNASGGTSTRDGCAHPFPIDPKVPLYLTGNIAGFVLFHNGFWSNWKNNLLEAAMRSRLKVPTEPWSDSRGLAWMASHFGHGVLELIDEKVVTFGPNKIEIFGSKDWKRINGVLCSNDSWERKIHTSSALPEHYRGGRHQPHHGAHSNPHTPSTPNGTGGETERKANGNATPGGGSQVTPFRGTAGAPGTSGTSEDTRGLSEQEAVQAGNEGARSVPRGTVLSPSAWARQINSKDYRRGSSVADDMVPSFERGPCTGCKKRNAIVSEGGRQYCFDCWHSIFGYDADGREVGNRLYLTGRCEHCHDREADSILVNPPRNWICGTCWHAAKRPDIRRVMKTGNKTVDDQAIEIARNQRAPIDHRAVM